MRGELGQSQYGTILAHGRPSVDTITISASCAMSAESRLSGRVGNGFASAGRCECNATGNGMAMRFSILQPPSGDYLSPLYLPLFEAAKMPPVGKPLAAYLNLWMPENWEAVAHPGGIGTGTILP